MKMPKIKQTENDVKKTIYDSKEWEQVIDYIFDLNFKNQNGKAITLHTEKQDKKCPEAIYMA